MDPWIPLAWDDARCGLSLNNGQSSGECRNAREWLWAFWLKPTFSTTKRTRCSEKTAAVSLDDPASSKGSQVCSRRAKVDACKQTPKSLSSH